MIKADEDRSVHITYDVDDHERRAPIRRALIELIEQARGEIPVKSFKVLDVGCGVGLLMRDLAELGYEVAGTDLDERCVEAGAKYGPCSVVDIMDLETEFAGETFDLTVLSHVLEHIPSPIEALQILKRVSSRWIVLAVPNPGRPHVFMKYSLASRDYSNRGHVYSWDRSHFTNFLTGFAGLEVVAWSSDGVRFLPGRLVRSPLRRLGLLDSIEGAVGRRFPYLSTSLVVLCRIPSTDS